MHSATATTAALTAAGLATTLLAGCSLIDSRSSTAPMSTTPPRDLDQIAVFDPCTQIPDQVLTAQGLDPASKTVVTDAPQGPTSWRVCNWEQTDRSYGLGLFSTSHTLDETRKNDTFTDIRDLTVNGRPGLTFHQKAIPTESCLVAFSAQQGMFEISANWLAGNKTRNGDLCAIARRHAAAFEPVFPN